MPRKTVPVYPLVGNSNTPTIISDKIINSPNIKHVNAINGNILPGPVRFGDLRHDGVPFHGGVYVHGKHPTIYYHNYNSIPTSNNRRYIGYR